MKNFTKVLVLTLAVLLVASMSAIFVGAANANPAVVVTDTTNNTITINKQINTSNEGDLAYYTPNITYSYSVAPGTGGNIVNDGTNQATIKAGVADGVTLTDSTAVFTSTAKAAGSGVSTLTDTLTASVDLTKFTAPGVYRYVLTDTTTDATLATAKVNREADFDDELILDVYIGKDGSGNIYMIGASLLEDATDATQAAGAKLTGWDNTSETPATDSLVDTYETYNVTITKTITGNSADKTHAFPFAITLANLTTDYYANSASTASSTTSLSTTLTNGGSYTITGLPADATVTVVETNDTADSYYVTVANGANTIVNGVQTATNGTQSTGAIELADYAKAANTRDQYASANLTTLAFTNNLDEVSPTGLLIRFAPFVLIAAVGVTVLAVSRRTKEETENI